MNKLNFVLAQVNLTVGDIDNNLYKILNACHEAKNFLHADIIIFPELALSGYPPEDLLFRHEFLEKISSALTNIQHNLPENLCIILGYPEKNSLTKQCHNSAIVMTKNKIITNYRKQILPNNGVFDEKRYFIEGTKNCVFTYKKNTIALFICEDLWKVHLTEKMKPSHTDFIIAINASPFNAGKIQTRLNKMKVHCKLAKSGLIYVNHCCGQDDLIFDGSSFVLNSDGKMICLAPFASESLQLFDSSASVKKLPRIIPTQEQLYNALVLGVRDYVKKNHFEKVVLGFSGGIDSSLTLAIATDALGKENVLPVIMPSQFTSELSLTCAKAQLKNMGMKTYRNISIDSLFNEFITQLNFPTEILTIQNIQARIRAVLLMGISNETNSLLLNTSNKSEIAVGYSTLYGDMCGAYAVIKDVWKTQVYELCHFRNQVSPIIPLDIITRPPTAELAHNQLDTDSLPPYDILDKILIMYIEEEKSMSQIIKSGFDKTHVKKIIQLIVKNEYKRKQSPLGPKITPLAFTRERRYPITSGFF